MNVSSGEVGGVLGSVNQAKIDRLRSPLSVFLDLAIVGSGFKNAGIDKSESKQQDNALSF